MNSKFCEICQMDCEPVKIGNGYMCANDDTELGVAGDIRGTWKCVKCQKNMTIYKERGILATSDFCDECGGEVGFFCDDGNCY